jgi:hypothetical protein
MWTAPQFRQPGGGWDWMQMADMFIPGNIWNSRTDQIRPMGVVQGMTGIPVDTALQAFQWLSNQRNPFEGAGDTVGSAFRAGGGLLNSLRNLRERGFRSEDDYYRNWDESVSAPRINAIAEDRAARAAGVRAGGGGNTVDSYSARTGGLGMGQLGRGSFASQMYYENAMRNRGGALMER